MRVLAVKRRLRGWTHSVRPSAPLGVDVVTARSTVA